MEEKKTGKLSLGLRTALVLGIITLALALAAYLLQRILHQQEIARLGEDHSQQITRILAEAVREPTLLEDQQQLQKLLSRIGQVEPAIAEMQILDRNQRILSRWSGKQPDTPGAEETPQAIEILQGDESRGRLLVHWNPDRLGERIESQLGGGVTLLFASLVLMALLSLIALNLLFIRPLKNLTVRSDSLDIRPDRETAEMPALELEQINEVITHLRNQVVMQQRLNIDIQHDLEQSRQGSRAKSEFLSHMSHELRTPLNAILGFAQLLEADIPGTLETDQRESVGHIIEGGRRLLDLINGLLELSAIDSGELSIHTETIDLLDVIGESLNLAQSMASQQSIQVTSQALPHLGFRVVADRSRLMQVMLHLLSNAIKYNREEGQVTILCPTERQGFVRVGIRDTGRGLSADDQEKAFVPFTRLDNASEHDGLGIGLSLSQRLIQQMGGRMGVESAEGIGSTFWFELKLA
jgi:signal transduction histidine kinase